MNKTPNTITMTVELSAEDRARLDAILEALQGSRANCKGCVEAALKVASTGKTSPQAAEQPEPEVVTTPEPEAAPAPEKQPERTVEHSDIQRKVVELSGAGKKAQVREIVKSYAERVTEIPEDKLVEAWDRLTALEV